MSESIEQDAPMSQAEFHQRIRRELDENPYESSTPHAATALITRACTAQPMDTARWLAMLLTEDAEQSPSRAADLLRCIGSCDRQSIIVTRHTLLTLGLRHANPHIRGAAVSAITTRRDSALIATFRPRSESDPRIENCMHQLQEEVADGLLHDRIECSFDAQPLEDDGARHPVEEMITEALRADPIHMPARLERIFDDFARMRPQIAADLLRCIGRACEDTQDSWVVALIHQALTHQDLRIRDVAVTVIDSWGNATLIAELKPDAEPNAHLAAFMRQLQRSDAGLGFRMLLRSILEDEPFMDGYAHPGERMIVDTFASAPTDAAEWLIAAYQDFEQARPLLTAHLLRCIGACDPAILGSAGVQIIQLAIRNEKAQIRSAAITAITAWRQPELFALLQPNAEADARLAERMRRILTRM